MLELATEAKQKGGSRRTNREPASSGPASNSSLRQSLRMPSLVGNQAVQQAVRSQVIQAKFAQGTIPTLDAGVPPLASATSAPCACGATCPKCSARPESAWLQRKAGDFSMGRFDGIPASRGERLPRGTRAALESHFKSDLSSVRVHTNSEAAASAKSLGALAYTSGRDIYFAPGTYAPSTRSGQRLLAHEVAHVVQQSSGKQPQIAAHTGDGTQIGAVGDGLEADADRHAEEFLRTPGQTSGRYPELPSGGMTTIQRDPETPHSPPHVLIGPVYIPPGAAAIQIGDWTFTTDQKQLHEELYKVAAERGIRGVQDALWYTRVAQNPTVCNTVEQNEACRQWAEAKHKVIPAMEIAVPKMEEEHAAFIDKFEQAAKVKALASLKASEDQQRSEAARYGISWEMKEFQRSDCMFGDCTEKKPVYSMGDKSPAVTALQSAATLLLGRRKEVEAARQAWRNANVEILNVQSKCTGVGEGAGAEMYSACPELDQARTKSAAAEKAAKEKEDAYTLMDGYLSEKYPILAVYSKLDENPEGLEKLSKESAGPGMANMLGKEIRDRLEKIEKVRDGLGDSHQVNVWRLPELMEMTGELFVLSDTPIWHKWVEDKIADEKPGVLASIALFVLNIAAIALAPATGGASLAVAAGVNAVVAVEHVKEYQMQKALAGTHFDKAKALSREDPSFFWLAVELIGVVVDAAAAFKAIATAARALKTAKEAGDAVRVARATEEVTEAAARAGRPDLAARILSGAEKGVDADANLAKALKLTDTEKGLLEAGAHAAEEELSKAGTIGTKAAENLSTKISGTGRIFVCHSPCEEMIAKYSELLGPEVVLEGEKASLKTQFLELQEAASKAAKSVAESAPDARAAAEKAAQELNVRIAEFEGKLAKETAYRQASQKISSLTPDAAGKILGLDKATVTHLATFEAEALERLAQLEAGTLKKLAGWGLDSQAINRILAKGQYVGHVKGQILEELLNLKMAKPGAIAEHVPKGLADKLAKQGKELQFIPGHAIADADGRMLTDGVIGFWEGDEFKIVTVFEAKGGAPAARGLGSSWTGIARAERPALYKLAQDVGLNKLNAYKDIPPLEELATALGRKKVTEGEMRDLTQNLAEALGEAASDVRQTKAAARKISLDEIIKKYPEDVQRAWSKLPQSEAGQVRKSIERLEDAELRIADEFRPPSARGPVTVKTSKSLGNTQAVGVLPGGVPAKGLEATLKEAGIKNFTRLEDIPADELNQMAESIAQSAAPKPAP